MSRPTRARGLKLMYLQKEIFTKKSRPTRARGLKPKMFGYTNNDGMSRPTRARGLKQFLQKHQDDILIVASYAGAWIETCRKQLKRLYHIMSRPTRARGLKPLTRTSDGSLGVSRPTRARGLKLIYFKSASYAFITSRPTRARGLKQSLLAFTGVMFIVASYAGAWIET